MKQKPKVTLGLCVKNAEATILQTVKSILNQDFPHQLIEIVVVDGCSKDKTLSIIQHNLPETAIRKRIYFENTGLGLARQKVVDNASGDCIIWVDGDMILPKDHVRKQVEFMEQNPTVGIGRAKYGMLHNSKLIAALENISFVLESLRHNNIVPLELSGTEGSIYRVKAIKQAGGFDKKIIGAGEDTELAHRIRATGWLAWRTQAIFYERCRETWKALWDEYFWWGYGGHYNYHKNGSAFNLYKMIPLAGFLAGLLRFARAYKLTYNKLMFLLPFHYTFKRIAWCVGFIKAHVDGYGHIVA